jgi:hypothetical protein
MTTMFDRYRVLAWVGGQPYTVALLRDPDLARAEYLNCDRVAAAMYKNAAMLTLVVEQARETGLTVLGSERELARRPLGRSEAQADNGQAQSARGTRRRRRRLAPSQISSRRAVAS